MKNTIIYSLLIFFLFSLNAFAYEDINLTEEEKNFLEKNTPLRLHNETNWPPYNYNENNQAKGFSIDYMNLLAKKLNIEVKYISGYSWDEFLIMLQNDKLDAMINISKNEQRAKDIAFTSIFHTAANAIYVKKGEEYIDSLEKLSGKTIVMPKGFFAQNAITKYYPKIKQILVTDSLEALKQLSLGKADATIGKKNVLDYVIAVNNISGVTPTSYVDDNRMVSLIRIGTSKKKLILRDILEKAQRNVRDEELLKLKRKWFGVNDIKKIEKNFLNKFEKDYILNGKKIRMCHSSDIKPIEFYENGKLQGISIDIVNKIEKLLDTKFEFVKTNSWEQAKTFLKKDLCDFIPSVTNGSELIGQANFTKTYLSYKQAIITQKDKPVVSGIEDILDKTLSIKYNSNLIELLNSINPDLEVHITANHRDTLEAVSRGKAYFTIQPLPIASYYMSKYALKNLYISRYTNMTYNINMAVNIKNELLLNILNKSLNQISQEEYKKINDNWITMSFQTIYDYKYFWQILFLILLLIVVLFYRHYVLDKHNKRLKHANDEIEEKNNQIKKQKELFENLYNKSSDGVIIMRKSHFSDVNESILKILKYKESELINKQIYEISPFKQPNKELSKTLSNKMIKKALVEGVNSFEWIFIDAHNHHIWVEIVLSSIEIENSNVIHMVIRDISNRKTLEQKLEDLNVNLEEKIRKEIKKNEINTQQLIQQSRHAQMGEMISMIAHQWRQPLAAISATTNNLLIKMFVSKTIDKEVFENELKLITDYSQYLSSTIDDFRNFFMLNKKKDKFDLESNILKSLNIIKTSLEANNIKLIINFNEKISLYTYSNELQQVVLNILKNSEDILLEKNQENKIISLTTYTEGKDTAIIKIHDNGGGIKETILEKIFDPYFSTKNKKNGTGLGLYMSKIIINDHCDGNLRVINEKQGVSFLIELPIINKNKEEENGRKV